MDRQEAQNDLREAPHRPPRRPQLQDERSQGQAAPERNGQTARADKRQDTQEDKGDVAMKGLYCPRPAHEAKNKKLRYLTDEDKTAGRKMSPKSLEAKSKNQR